MKRDPVNPLNSEEEKEISRRKGLPTTTTKTPMPKVKPPKIKAPKEKLSKPKKEN